MYSRLLLNIYTNHKLHVRQQDEFSETFTTINGVKQGGVISPILFCVYMDGLLTELANSVYGCYMGGVVFAGVFGYVDDLKLVTPSVYALHQMAHICENYARYDITFNAKKGQAIIYKAYNVKPPDPCVIINGASVKCFNNVIYLGHLLTQNVYEFNVSKMYQWF